MKIKTNNTARRMVCLFDLPGDAQLDFDYLRESDNAHDYRIVKYKGNYYDVFDSQAIHVNESRAPMGWAMVIKPDSPLAKYDAIISESYFSGVIFKLVKDGCEYDVICASYFE